MQGPIAKLDTGGGSAACTPPVGTRNASPQGASGSDPAWFFCLTSCRIASLVMESISGFLKVHSKQVSSQRLLWELEHPLDNLQAATLLNYLQVIVCLRY